MSNASNCYSIVKSHQDRNGSQSEYLLTLVTFWGGAAVSSNQRRHVVWVTVASQCFQVPTVANFPTSVSFYNCVTMDKNPASVHSACSMLLRMLLEQRWKLQYVVTTLDLMFRKIFWDLMYWKTSCWNDVVLKVVAMIFLWDIENVPTAVHICAILIGTVQQRWVYLL